MTAPTWSFVDTAGEGALDDPPIFRELAAVTTGSDQPVDSGSAWFGAPDRSPAPVNGGNGRTPGATTDQPGSSAPPYRRNGSTPTPVNGSGPTSANGSGPAPASGSGDTPLRRLPIRAPGLWLLAEFARDVLSDHLLNGDDCTCGLPAAECAVIRRAYQYELIADEP